LVRGFVVRGETKKKKQQTWCLDAIEDTEAHHNVQRVEQLRNSVYFHTTHRPSSRNVPLCCTVTPTAIPNHRRWCGIRFPTRWSHGHASARSRDRAHPAPTTSHPRDVVLKATSQRLAGSHGVQRGFFVAVAKDSLEVTLVIESVLRLLFEFQVMSGAYV